MSKSPDNLSRIGIPMAGVLKNNIDLQQAEIERLKKRLKNEDSFSIREEISSRIQRLERSIVEANKEIEGIDSFEASRTQEELNDEADAIFH